MNRTEATGAFDSLRAAKPALLSLKAQTCHFVKHCLEPFFLVLIAFIYSLRCAKIFTVTIPTELYCSIIYEPEKRQYKCTESCEKVSSAAHFCRALHDSWIQNHQIMYSTWCASPAFTPQVHEVSEKSVKKEMAQTQWDNWHPAASLTVWWTQGQHKIVNCAVHF